MHLILDAYDINCSGGKESLIKEYCVCKYCEHTKRFVPDEESFIPIISNYPFEVLRVDLTFSYELKSKGFRKEYQGTAKDHFQVKDGHKQSFQKMLLL